MAIKKLQNNFTTPEQSKRLLELGVPADSADCYFQFGFENLIWIRTTTSEKSEYFFDRLINGHSLNIPCWSVGRLMEILYECYMMDMKFRYFRFNHLYGGMIDSLVQIFEDVSGDIDFSKLEE